jgi:hypothetical protein
LRKRRWRSPDRSCVIRWPSWRPSSRGNEARRVDDDPCPHAAR